MKRTLTRVNNYLSKRQFEEQMGYEYLVSDAQQPLKI
jgi:hypothetical protein